MGLREVFHAMRRRGAPLPGNFLARIDFAELPVNDNDMPGATGRAPRMAAATAVLDRGHGKPTTNVEAKVATMDMTKLHLEALLELSRAPTHKCSYLSESDA